MNFQKMTKKQLEAHGRTIGIELDRRKTKKALIAELTKATKKHADAKLESAKKAVAKKAVADRYEIAKKKASVKKAPVAKKESFLDKWRKFFNL